MQLSTMDIIIRIALFLLIITLLIGGPIYVFIRLVNIKRKNNKTAYWRSAIGGLIIGISVSMLPYFMSVLLAVVCLIAWFVWMIKLKIKRKALPGLVIALTIVITAIKLPGNTLNRRIGPIPEMKGSLEEICLKLKTDYRMTRIETWSLKNKDRIITFSTSKPMHEPDVVLSLAKTAGLEMKPDFTCVWPIAIGMLYTDYPRRYWLSSANNGG